MSIKRAPQAAVIMVVVATNNAYTKVIPYFKFIPGMKRLQRFWIQNVDLFYCKTTIACMLGNNVLASHPARVLCM